jgi:four helix bundle suffix protein
MADGFTPPHGGYANLLSYRKAEIVYDATYETFRRGIEHRDPAISANVIVGLIKATNYLLGRQLRRLEKDFLKEGGLRERMTRARLTERNKQRKKNRRH